MILVFIFLPFLVINAVGENWNDERQAILEKISDLYRRGKVQNDAMEKYEQKIAQQQEQIQTLMQNDKHKEQQLETFKTNYKRYCVNSHIIAYPIGNWYPF